MKPSGIGHSTGTFITLLSGAVLLSGCSDSKESAPQAPYDTTPVASQSCPPDQPEQCVAAFGDPTQAGTPSNDDPQAPQITKFVPRAYYGDAPFETELLFEVSSPSGASPSV